VLPETDLTGARLLAEQIRHAIEALPPLSKDGHPITVSIGAASARPEAGDQQARLFSEADQALYHAKSRGRNRVESNAGEPSASH
jgi:diguanylate cyclase (GGDEF)-like protein